MSRARTALRASLVTLVVVVAASAAVDVQAAARTSSVTNATDAASIGAAVAASVHVPLYTPAPPVVVVPRSTVTLAVEIEQLIAASGATVGVTLVELGGSQALSLSLNGNSVFTAASTYKLAALMMEAQSIASGATDPNGLVCFTDDDYEDGWFADYVDGACFTRIELASRAAKQSDNTAGHILVRDVGGTAAIDAWAASLGATNSAFFDPNTTTSNDLAALWIAEAQGQLGGAAAQGWLYPLLTDTAYESAIPAGVGAGATVVHKTGSLDLTENDAALVLGLSSGPYVLTVMTDGLDPNDGTALIAALSNAVWQFEAARS